MSINNISNEKILRFIKEENKIVDEIKIIVADPILYDIEIEIEYKGNTASFSTMQSDIGKEADAFIVAKEVIEFLIGEGYNANLYTRLRKDRRVMKPVLI